MKVIAGFLGLAIAAAIWQFRAHFPFDDTFISFRYAEHVASGHGLVWNIGGPHTEGYTNLLFILLLSAARFLTSDLLAASQFLGLVSTIITGVIIYSIAQDARGKHTGLIAIAFFWLTPLTWINAMSGMETSLFVMLSALAILLAIRNRFFEAYAAAFLATLTRPEGALLGIIIFIVAIGFSHQPGTLLLRTLKSTATKAAVAFVMALALYALWKWWYFGELLPNSFYVKVLSTSHVLFPGLQYVRLFAVSTLVLIALSLGIRGWRTRVVAATGVWTVLLLVFYCFVLPLEGLYDRFLWPAFSMLCVMAAIGLRDFSERRTLRLSLVFAIVLVLHLGVSMLSPRTKQSLAAREEIWDASMDPVVNVLRQLPHRDSLRFAYGDAGYVIYKSGIHHIDLFGLNDTRIAHARSVSEREAIVDSEQPDILLLPIHSRDSCEDWVEDAYGLARTKDFEPIVSSEAFPFTLVWLLNVNSPYYEECKLTLLHNLKASENHLRPAPILCYSTR
jgi:arabinofuranosyltransferase